MLGGRDLKVERQERQALTDSDLTRNSRFGQRHRGHRKVLSIFMTHSSWIIVRSPDLDETGLTEPKMEVKQGRKEMSHWTSQREKVPFMRSQQLISFLFPCPVALCDPVHYRDTDNCIRSLGTHQGHFPLTKLAPDESPAISGLNVEWPLKNVSVVSMTLANMEICFKPTFPFHCNPPFPRENVLEFENTVFWAWLKSETFFVLWNQLS